MYPCVLETPFNHLESNSLESTFPYIFAQNFRFYSHFLQAGQQIRRKARTSHDCDPLPNRPTPMTITPSYSPVQGNIHAAAPVTIPRSPPATQEERFTSRRAKIFSSVHPHLFFPSHIVSTPTVPAIPPPSIWQLSRF